MNILEQIDVVEERFAEREAEVRAFVPEEGRFERLRREAKILLSRFPDSGERPPMFGVLIGVKDIFRVGGFPTRAGSRLPAEVFEGPEAEPVKKLKAAGTLVLGKTVTTEFAYFAPGPTRNPHNLAHTPGGSSSGSAAAVAADFCPLALGSQTIGSVIRPAAFCGVVGFKPSYGRISREGVIPLAPSVDHVGFFTPDVAAARNAANQLVEDWKPAVATGRKPVLAIASGPYLEHVSEEGRVHFRDACQKLAEASYEIREVQVMPDFEQICERHNLIVAAEAARVHADWFAAYGDLYHPRTAELVRRGQVVPEADLTEALNGRERLRDDLTRLMENIGIDLWVSPAATGAAPQGLESTGDPVMNLPWTHAGLPTINLPAGRNPIDLPLGLQVSGGWYGDELLLAWAGGIEKVLREDVIRIA
jgi:Asp-tRNA(Asn)/Glu-tRNA(Gln) amidotransferase A subunit family amidase